MTNDNEQLSVPEPSPFEIPEAEKIQIERLEAREFLSPVSAAPTHIPVHPLDAFALYINGATKRLYIFDTSTNTWLYTTLS
jgi:hypothetical protein